MEQLHLFDLTGTNEDGTSGNKIRIVNAQYISSELIRGKELFDGFDEMYAITYSSGIQFMSNLLDQFEYAEIIFGCEGLVDDGLAAVMAVQAKIIEKLTKNKNYKKICEKVDEGNLHLFVSRAIKSHEKVFCLKAKGQKEPTRNEQPVLNSSKIRVAGVTLEPYEGLLMPMQCRLVTDEDKNGEERSYYEINVTIRRHPKGWLKYVENVGTMARFKKSDGTLTVAMPIYRYYKWTSKDEVLNLKQPPVLGNIHDVYAARSVYAELLFPGKSNTAEYWNAWQKPPYEEVKEPLYLAADGTIDEAALADASKGLQMRYFIATPASWKQYELPDKKELA